MAVVKVFISATSTDLKSYRLAIRDLLLTRRNVLPVLQDHLPPDYRPVKDVLTTEIEDCDAVIHLVGRAYGQEPKNRPEDQPRRSYTQLEYHTARELNKPIYHFLAAEDCKLDAVPAEAQELQGLQEAHRQFIRGLDPMRTPFRSKEEICQLIGVIEFPDSLGGPPDGPSGGRFQLFRIPAPADDGLFVGRDAVIAELDRIRRSGRSGIVVIHGFGGVGKTTVLWHWLKQLATDYEGLSQAFDWSFYNQGTDTGGKVSSRPFLNAAVEHFRRLGCKFLDGVRPDFLGDMVGRAFLRTGGLMVLDGMEPLQHLPDIHGGRCQDQELSDFIHALARNGRGPHQRPWLLVVTTRWPIPSVGDTFHRIEVTKLVPTDGAELLSRYRTADGRRLMAEPPSGLSTDEERLRAIADEFRAAAVSFGCQPLALILLASYLIETHGGNLALWKTVAAGGVVDEGRFAPEYRHARLVMSQYDQMLRVRERDGPNAGVAGAARRILGLVSLFDRPADRHLLQVVRSGEPILGLTDELTEARFAAAIRYLRGLQLLAPGADDRFDTHPLIRERFAEVVRTDAPDGWREAHTRLFRHLSADPLGTAETDSTRFDRLSQAVAHGCRADAFAETANLYLNVLVESQPGRDAWKKLASMGDDLAVLSHFFEVPWYDWRRDREKRPAAVAIGPDSGELLNESGFDLFKLCRFSEAERSFEAAVPIWVAAANWRKASRDTVLLGKARVALGKLKAALVAAGQAVAHTDTLLAVLPTDTAGLAPDELARQKMPRKERMNALFFLGEAHHHVGNWAEAGSAFARAVQQEEEYARLYADDGIYTVRVFQYANYLLDRGDLVAAEERVARAQAICERKPENHRLDMAYNRYLLGRIAKARGLARKDSKAAEFDVARPHLEAFLKACWEQAMTDGRVIAHLALAELDFGTGDANRCEKHLADAEELCEPEDVRRFRCECLIGRTRFHLWREQREKAREYFDRAIEEVVHMGYFRRAGQLRAMASEAGWPVPRELSAAE